MKTSAFIEAIAKGEISAKQLFSNFCDVIDKATITRFGEANGYFFESHTECLLEPEQKIIVARAFEEAARLAATRYKELAITSAIRHCPTGGTYTIDGITYAVTIKHGDRPDELLVNLRSSLQQ